MKRKLDYNAPVVLTYTFVAFLILVISLLSKGKFGELLAVRYTSWADPLQYVRLLTHTLTHADITHYTSNFMMILLLGPLVEEKYGSNRLLIMMLITSVITGLISIIFFKNVMLMGASGVVFMFILLASFANVREGTIPLTVILVAIFYIGNEIVTGVFGTDNIAQLAHIIGGVCGTVFGFVFAPRKGSASFSA